MPFEWRRRGLRYSHLRPAAELHQTLLVVEREPSDVDLTGALEDARRHIQTRAVVIDHHIGPKGAVELLVGADQQTQPFMTLPLDYGNQSVRLVCK